MKKIIISLAIIGAVAGITFGITGAWWTDQGTSTNQSFHSGSLDLRLSNNGTSWGDDVTQTWNVQNMVPGGTSYESTLYMKNNGSVNADYLKFTLKNTPNPAGMDKVMRITKLEYAGKNLLTGGAGADLSSYVAPTNCTVTVSGTKIRDAITTAADNAVICVAPGNYNAAWEGAEPLVVNKKITIASTGGPSVTTVGVGFQIAADNVTIKGFKVTPSTFLGETSSFYMNGGFKDVTVAYNDIDGLSMANARGVLFVTGGTYTNFSIDHNKMHHLATGVYTNPHTGVVVIKYNEIYNTVAGIGGLTGANVQFNKFHNNSEAVGADNSYASVTLSNNEFLDGDIVKNYRTDTVSVNAENNWWGDFDPSDQVVGNVDYSPYAGGPFIGYINGKDYNSNGFADLNDFYGITYPSYNNDPIVIENPDLLPNSATYHTLKMGVQLDGPTTGSTFMGGSVGMDMTVIMGQGPVQ